MNFLYTYLILLIYFIIWFIISQIKKNNGLIDIAWGFSFIVTAISSLIISKELNIYKIVITLITIIWGLRLSVYLFIRNWNKKEDFRYQAMRNKWQTKLKLKAFFKVFLSQSIFSYVISLPILLTNFYAINLITIQSLIILIVGIIIFIIGFSFEVLADMQLKKFKSNPLNKNKILKTGVWSYTRHPNYFGETTLWWGIGIVALSPITLISFISLISPLIITLLLRYVTGVPLLEKKYKTNLEYQEYSKYTPIFIPIRKKAIK